MSSRLPASRNAVIGHRGGDADAAAAPREAAITVRPGPRKIVPATSPETRGRHQADTPVVQHVPG